MRQQQIIKAIMLSLFLTVSLNLGGQLYRMIRDDLKLQRLSEEHPGITVCKFGIPINESSRFYIELTLLVAFIGARIRKFPGRLLYFAGLIGTAIFYISWWKYYFRMVEM